MEDKNFEKTLTLADMHNLLSLIDNSTVRGAIRGEDLLTLGTLRNKISLIIESVEKRLAEEQRKEIVADND